MGPVNHHDLSHLDAAYVLGALDPAERQAFEEHLRSCEPCAGAVRELSGLPRLLDRVDASVFADAHEERAPETLLPALLREVRHDQRRRTGRLIVAAAAAVALVVGGGLVWTAVVDDEPARDAVVATPGPSEGPSAVPMQQVGQQILQASVVLEEVAWGTRLELTCSYAAPKEPDLYGQAPAATYTLVVQTQTGQWEQVAAWRAVPGRTVTVPAATQARPAQITAVEVRTSSGRPVLELSE